MINEQPKADGNHLHGSELHTQGWSQQVDALHKAMAREVARGSALYGLTPTESRLIRLLLTQEDWTATKLAPELATRVSHISRIASKLVDIGLIDRRRPRDDRRLVLLKLTDKGRAVGQELQQAILAYEEKLTDGLDESDLRSLMTIVGRMLENDRPPTEQRVAHPVTGSVIH